MHIEPKQVAARKELVIALLSHIIRMEDPPNEKLAWYTAIEEACIDGRQALHKQHNPSNNTYGPIN